MLLCLTLLSLVYGLLACDTETDSTDSFKSTGIVCRITRPAALVLNEQTTQVIQAAFKHAKYPDMKGEKSVMFIGKVSYGLNNLEIFNLSIGKSEVDLIQDGVIKVDIHNVSASFKGTLYYGYGGWLVNVGHSVDFEIESHIDLQVNTRLYCGEANRVVADTSDCYLTFHKLLLHLQGDKQPSWIKRLFTDFVSYTVRLVIKSQICKEINNLANILAEFIQQRAGLFLSSGDIGVDISVTNSPVLTADHIESHHKGLLLYKNVTSVIEESVFSPDLLTESRMLYFWISDQVLRSLVMAAHDDQRLVQLIMGQELKELFRNHHTRGILHKIFSSEDPEAKLWSLTTPQLSVSPLGTIVRTLTAVEIRTNSSQPEAHRLYFETDIEVIVQASYSSKKLFLDTKPALITIQNLSTSNRDQQGEDEDMDYFKELVQKIGIPKVVSYLENGLTELMNRNGLHLFEIINPQVITEKGYIIIQLDFGFPHHLLVDFLKRAL
ncbi:CETP protein, partial [Polypterus senegalus]|nr:cholesteryl ester transfer protein [Polypterus senegalus]MBN3292555.1 CETP protein [Polypterus senegalus]